MTIFLGILLTIAIFTCIVFLHEMGHFLTARLTKMRVEEFGIGIPPHAKTLFEDKKWTHYTLNWLPIGGFVRIKWEDPMSDEAHEKDAFSAKKWWARSLVLIAWVTMNFILAIVIFFWFFIIGTSPIWPNLILDKDYGSLMLPSFDKSIETGYITHSGLMLSPLTGSIAERAWVLAWDQVIALDGQVIDDIDGFRAVLADNAEHTLIVSGTGWERPLVITPEGGKIGVRIDYKDLSINDAYHMKLPFSEAVIASLYETYALSHLTFDVLISTVRKLVSPVTPSERKEATEMLSWPIGIGSTFTDVVEAGLTWKIVFSIIALLSINLWVLNILPFPALDGGRLVSTTARSIIGLFYKKTKMLDKIEYIIHAFGMVFLLAVSLLIAILDITKLL